MLWQLLYISDTKPELTSEDLQAIHATSLRNNAARNVTGILIHNDGHFVQLLEGEQDVIRSLFQKIVNDDRHEYVKLLFDRPATGRLFSEWGMAMLDLDQAHCTNHDRMDLQDMLQLIGYQVHDAEGDPFDLSILKRFRQLLTAV